MFATLSSGLRRWFGAAILMHRLNIRQHARYDARQPMPVPNDDRPAPTEVRIAEQFTHTLDRLERERTRALQSERVAAIATQLTGEPDTCADIAAAARGSIHDAVRRFSAAWRQALQTVDACRDDLRDFRRENLLVRPANYHSPWLGVSVLFTVFAVEVGFNSLLFAEVSPWGDAGGFATAAALALPNLTAGLVKGFCALRALHHVRPGVRVFGSVVLFASVLVATVWTLFVGHLRLEAATDAQAAATLLSDWRATLDNLRDDPLAPLKYPPALGLMFLQLVGFVIATIDGLFGFADRYPGYASVDRRLRRAIVDAERLKTKFYTQLGRIIRRAITDIETRRGMIDRKSKDALLILDRARGVALVYDQKSADQHFVHRQSLATYHELNARHRSDAAIPSRFQTSDIPCPRHALPAYDWHAAREKIAEIRTQAHAATSRLIHDLEAVRLQIINDVEGGIVALPSSPRHLSGPDPTQSAEAA